MINESTAFMASMLFSLAILLEVVLVPIDQRLFQKRTWSEMTARERHGLALMAMLGIVAFSVDVAFLLDK